MTKRPLKDVGTSVRARLLRIAHERGEDFQFVLTRYANERLLFRLASSAHSSRFVLKGAALFTVWTGKQHRATRDLVVTLKKGRALKAQEQAAEVRLAAFELSQRGVDWRDIAIRLRYDPLRVHRLWRLYSGYEKTPRSRDEHTCRG